MQQTLVLRELVQGYKVLHKERIPKYAKAILYDVFTYSCMNCLRSWGFLEKLHEAYRNYGLELVIIHPFEWNFERDERNVKRALKELNIHVPVILDPQRKLIKKLNVNFWPAQILVKDGEVVYRHIGEGGYKQLELVIRKNIGNFQYGEKSIFPSEPKYSKIPAVYCGKRKNKKVFCNDGLPKEFGVLHASGACRQADECLISRGPDSCIFLKTKGNKVNVVAQTIGKKNSLLLARWNKGCRQRKVLLRVSNPKLYHLLNAPAKNGTLALSAIRGKAAIYSFAFE